MTLISLSTALKFSILLLFQEFFGKREKLSLQPCITRADMRRKAYARTLHLKLLSDTIEGLTMLFHSLSAKLLTVNGLLARDFSWNRSFRPFYHSDLPWLFI